MKSRFAKYLSLVGTLDSSDPFASAIKQDIDLISSLCHHVQEAIEAYHSGWPGKAFACIENAMDHEKMWTMVTKVTTPAAGHPIWKELYRIRVAGPEGGRFTKADLFHVPFELRHLVRRQRYSIPGLPCLYLGGSLYVCWEEMGRPPFDTVYTARYELGPKFGVGVLDFSVAPQGWASILERIPENQPLPERCICTAVIWPLMAACSVRRKYDDSPFIEEYILPQMVLQWVTAHNHVQGIAYFSVMLEPRTDTSTIQTNLVFPVRKSAPAGACEALRQWFTLTEPAYWPLLEPGDTIDNPRRGIPHTHDHLIELMRGHSLFYGRTPFGLREIELLKRDAGPI